MKHNISTKLFVIGKKGVKYLSARNYSMEILPQGDDDEISSQIISRVAERYENKETAGAAIAFSRFINAARQTPTFWNFLPLYKKGNAKERNLEYLYEFSRGEALGALCDLTLKSTMQRVLRESRAAELAARMSAMDNATKNATDMIAHLTFVYNRVRQEEITSELMDIVGGAEALK